MKFSYERGLNASSLMQLMEDYKYIIMNEASNQKNQKHFKMQPLDVDGLIKANNIQEVTEPVFFVRDGIPTSNGLLSNEIFGITKEERANIFGYINLHDWFMHPLVYKVWSRMDRRIAEIVHGTKTYSIGPDGDFVEDPAGSNGVAFLKKNIDKIKIKSTESRKRDKKIMFIEKYKNVIFMNKLIVIPPYYRDVQHNNGRDSVGILNKYYSQLLISVRSLIETQDYGLSMSNAVRGRIQETIVNIYDCLCGTGSSDEMKANGIGLSKKKGLIRNAVMSKTTNEGTRLIISAPELKVERLDDLMVDIEHCTLPLASAIVNFKPFIIFWIKRFFENEFGGGTRHQLINTKGEIEWVDVKDPLITFSEDRIKNEIKRFVHGFSNRFSPVEVPLMNGKISYMRFKGHNATAEEVAAGKPNPEAVTVSNRKLTWCDIFYMAAHDCSLDKHVLLTRFPIDTSYNQFPTKFRISTIKNTTPVFINGVLYKNYPLIRPQDIGSNTSQIFIDTLQMCNLMLKAIGGDYDGDQVSVKGVYTIEANEELDKYIKSKKNYIGLGGKNLRVPTNEAMQLLYNLTLTLNDTPSRFTNPVFK